MKNSKKFIGITIMMALFLAGCQAPSTPSPTPEQNTQNTLPIPSSNGPTSDPSTMKGPDSPPPETSSQASSQTPPGDAPQSASENDNVHLTLPTN